MSNHHGRNAMQARIASLKAHSNGNIDKQMIIAKKISETGVGRVAANRAEKRFAAKQNRKVAA